MNYFINSHYYLTFEQEPNGQHFGMEPETRMNGDHEKMSEVKKATETSISQAVRIKHFMSIGINDNHHQFYEVWSF